MSKQFDLTVTIRVTVPDAILADQYEEAFIIANSFAEMATRYKSIGADEIVEVTVKGTENV